MKVYVRAAAEREIAQIFDWLLQAPPGLAGRFEAELSELIQRISEHPKQFPMKHRTVRQALFPSLPYRLFFVVRSSRVDVIGVIHQTRDPARWP